MHITIILHKQLHIISQSKHLQKDKLRLHKQIAKTSLNIEDKTLRMLHKKFAIIYKIR